MCVFPVILLIVTTCYSQIGSSCNIRFLYMGLLTLTLQCRTADPVPLLPIAPLQAYFLSVQKGIVGRP